MNELPFDWPMAFKKEVIDSLAAKPWHRYITGTDSIEKKLSKVISIPPDNLLLTSGNSDAIDLFFKVFVINKGRYIQLYPSFYRYKMIAKITGITPILQEITENESYINSLEKVIAQNENVPIVICNPNNPTGTALPQEALYGVLSKTHSPVFLDLTYEKFLTEEHDINKFLSLKNVMQAFTFSKSFGTAGIRIGWIAISDTMKHKLKNLRELNSLNWLSICCLDKMLEDKWLKYADIKLTEVMAIKNKTVQEITNLQGVKLIDCMSNFIYIKVDGIHTRALYAFMLNKGIICKVWVHEHDELLKISIGTAEEMTFFLNQLKKVLLSGI